MKDRARSAAAAAACQGLRSWSQWRCQSQSFFADCSLWLDVAGWTLLVGFLLFQFVSGGQAGIEFISQDSVVWTSLEQITAGLLNLRLPIAVAGHAEQDTVQLVSLGKINFLNDIIRGFLWLAKRVSMNFHILQIQDRNFPAGS